MTEDVKRDHYTEEDEAYFRSEVEHARRRAKATIAEFLEQTGYIEIDFLRNHVKNNSLDESEKNKLVVLIEAIAFLENDLLVWAKEGAREE
jgi:hypothetical protein